MIHLQITFELLYIGDLARTVKKHMFEYIYFDTMNKKNKKTKGLVRSSDIG